MTSLVDRLERELYAAATARPRDSARYAAVGERAVQACSADPKVAEVLDLADLYVELATEYENLGRCEDALAAADAAVDAGLRSNPDPRCLRAEILMRAGRVAEAEPIWAEVRTDTPDDVWLYNNAGLEYAHAGVHETALGWLTDGLRLALRTADPDQLVEQLTDLRQESLDKLDRPADALQEHAARFLREKQQARSPWMEEPTSEPTNAAAHGPVDTVALAWLPSRRLRAGGDVVARVGRERAGSRPGWTSAASPVLPRDAATARRDVAGGHTRARDRACAGGAVYRLVRRTRSAT